MFEKSDMLTETEKQLYKSYIRRRIDILAEYYRNVTDENSYEEVIQIVSEILTGLEGTDIGIRKERGIFVNRIIDDLKKVIVPKVDVLISCGVLYHLNPDTLDERDRKAVVKEMQDIAKRLLKKISEYFQKKIEQEKGSYEARLKNLLANKELTLKIMQLWKQSPIEICQLIASFEYPSEQNPYRLFSTGHENLEVKKDSEVVLSKPSP